MIRTQVLLEEDQYEFLKRRSTNTGVSLSAMVRDGVELLRRAHSPLRRQAIDLLGSFEADRDDVSIRHDDYFAGLEPPEE